MILNYIFPQINLLIKLPRHNVILVVFLLGFTICFYLYSLETVSDDPSAGRQTKEEEASRNSHKPVLH